MTMRATRIFLIIGAPILAVATLSAIGLFAYREARDLTTSVAIAGVGIAAATLAITLLAWLFPTISPKRKEKEATPPTLHVEGDKSIGYAKNSHIVVGDNNTINDRKAR